MTDEWISTGKAARMVGYSRWWFLLKFEDALPCLVLPSGHRRWLRSAVVALVVLVKKGPVQEN